jgi:haloalkane dehalogenase
MEKALTMTHVRGADRRKAEAPDFTPAAALFPFESRWLESSVGRVHYVDEGEGQPILMCHGNPTWSFLYRHVITALRDRFRCVALDYPGFGLSVRPAGYGYTPADQASVVGELVRELDLRRLIVMAHDWGGPIGLAAACADPTRVAGLVLGGTWFWPPDLRFRMFSRVMSSWPLQRAILQRNLFVERFIPAGTTRELSAEEMEHYRRVQPTPEARVGVAELPRQIVRATPFLADLAEAVPRVLGAKRVLITFPMRDSAFRPADVLPRLRSSFSDTTVVELANAGHYFVEDAPHEVASAVRNRFPPGLAVG